MLGLDLAGPDPCAALDGQNRLRSGPGPLQQRRRLRAACAPPEDTCRSADGQTACAPARGPLPQRRRSEPLALRPEDPCRSADGQNRLRSGPRTPAAAQTVRTACAPRPGEGPLPQRRRSEPLALRPRGPLPQRRRSEPLALPDHQACRDVREVLARRRPGTSCRLPNAWNFRRARLVDRHGTSAEAHVVARPAPRRAQNHLCRAKALDFSALSDNRGVHRFTETATCSLSHCFNLICAAPGDFTWLENALVCGLCRCSQISISILCPVTVIC